MSIQGIIFKTLYMHWNLKHTDSFLCFWNVLCICKLIISAFMGGFLSPMRVIASLWPWSFLRPTLTAVRMTSHITAQHWWQSFCQSVITAHYVRCRSNVWDKITGCPFKERTEMSKESPSSFCYLFCLLTTELSLPHWTIPLGSLCLTLVAISLRSFVQSKKTGW